LRFGFPSVPAGLASMMIQVINRPIMGAMMGTAAVGVFQANYRLGIFMMLLVSMFDFAWRPFFLSHANDHDARPLFARVLTYYTLIATGIFLFLTFFIGDLVTLPIFAGRSLFARPYWGGLGIVPWVLLGYLFLGVYNNLLAGIYIEKKTRYLPAVTFTGAAVNIVATILLIPPWGMMGAAFATFLAYFLMALALYLVVRRFYPVPYEWKRLLKIALAAGVAIALYILVDPGTHAFLWKIALLLLFVLLLTIMKFFVPSEIAGVTRLLSRSSGPGVPPPDDGV
jgi:O-antigen/teichoic acid export membrane protein